MLRSRLETVARREDTIPLACCQIAFQHRLLQSTIDAIRNYPEFPQGSRNWDERVFHPNANGDIRPICEFWRKESAPLFMRAVIVFVQLMGRGPVSGGLRLAWNESNRLRHALGENEV